MLGLELDCVQTDTVHLYFRSPEFKNGPHQFQQRWIMNASGKNDKGWPVIFANVYKKYSYTETVRQIEQTENKVPWDLLRLSSFIMSGSCVPLSPTYHPQTKV